MTAWAIRWRSENRLDGKTERLVGRFCRGASPVPDAVSGYTKAVFKTRQQARKFLRDNYGYIRFRKDLQAEPHGWKPPKVVKVVVTVQEIETT